MNGALYLAALPLYLVALLGCGMSAGAGMGGFYHDGGPHPYVSFAAVAQVGPLEVMTAPVTQTQPVHDMVQATANWGPGLGAWQPIVGLGWSWWRTWESCNSTGHWCGHEWSDDLVVNTGLTYRARPFRADLRYTFYGAEAPLSGAPWLTAGFEILLGGES